MIYRRFEKLNSTVEHPKHYRLEGIREVLDVIRYALSEEEYMGFLKGNVIKYALRAPYKGELEQDWEKAAYYADLVKKSSEAFAKCASGEEKPLEEDFESEEEELLRMVDYLDDYLAHYIKSTRPKKA